MISRRFQRVLPAPCDRPGRLSRPSSLKRTVPNAQREGQVFQRAAFGHAERLAQGRQGRYGDRHADDRFAETRHAAFGVTDAGCECAVVHIEFECEAVVVDHAVVRVLHPQFDGKAQFEPFALQRLDADQIEPGGIACGQASAAGQPAQQRDAERDDDQACREDRSKARQHQWKIEGGHAGHLCVDRWAWGVNGSGPVDIQSRSARSSINRPSATMRSLRSSQRCRRAGNPPATFRCAVRRRIFRPGGSARGPVRCRCRPPVRGHRDHR